MLKAPFFLDIFNILSELFVYVEKGLIRKLKLVWKKNMTLQTKQEIITIHILPNICRSKGNQTIKIGQFIDYNIRNIVLEKLHKKWDE